MSKIAVEGPAHLCFLPNGRFSGHVIGASDHKYALVGGPDYCQNAGEPHDHDCCYDKQCKFRDITVFDYEGFGESVTVPHVFQSGSGADCMLTSKNLHFFTTTFLTGQEAEECIEKLFSSELLGKNCNVCIGNLKISFPEFLPEDKE